MNMFDAIFSRRTIRHFIQEKVEWEVLSDILDFANRLRPLIEGIAVEYKLVSNIEKKQAFRGPLSIKAPYYICISSEEKEDHLINAGYLIEQINLYITSKGLGTCYLGSSNPGRSLKSDMKFDYIVALAFGKTYEPLYRESSEAKRLPEQEVIIYKEETSSDIRQILTAARLAPSSYNTQPWRFVVYKNRIHVFTRKNVFIGKLLDFDQLVDMGIMLSNLLLAAEELWVDMKITKSDSIKNKSFQNNEYICTLIIG